ncbi:hypothetical protein AB0C34_17920 [Nocardia sp. NPDC049220]|uniref:hypothetical protein n=1 Tax=Nocardia sp. NPDC049220 TaxID=3155273 RepID=UPI0034045D79
MPDPPKREEIEDGTYDDFDDAPVDLVGPDPHAVSAVPQAAAKPAPRAKKSPHVKRKNFPVENAFVEELMAARIKWHTDDPARMAHFGGMASENAFLQAVARLGIEAITKNQKAANRLMRLFPQNARTR